MQIFSENLVYQVNNKKMVGYIAYPNNLGKNLPGILVVDEAWGITTHSKQRARMLASLGYVAFAIDLYGEGRIAKDYKESIALSKAFSSNNSLSYISFYKALEILQENSLVNPNQIGAIGFSFGGEILFQNASIGLPLKGIVIFHSIPQGFNPHSIGISKTKIKIFVGKNDIYNPPKFLKEFEEMMNKAKNRNYEIITYENTSHSFTNFNADFLSEEYDLPMAYNHKSDMLSWNEMKKFFEDLFSPKYHNEKNKYYLKLCRNQ